MLQTFAHQAILANQLAHNQVDKVPMIQVVSAKQAAIVFLAHATPMYVDQIVLVLLS